MKKFAGIDLHSNNAMCAIVNSSGKRICHKRLDCNVAEIGAFFKPHKRDLEFIALESTFNWYWLADGLEDQGYDVRLANPAAMEQYTGLKHSDDKSDAYFLAELSRLGILPIAWICERKIRPIRDLLRRRLFLVRQRTAQYLSFKGLYARNTGSTLDLGILKTMDVEEAAALYDHDADCLIAQEQKKVIDSITESIDLVEKRVTEHLKPSPEYQRVQTTPGVGKILAMTICLETGPISRFSSPGDYASYCRTVEAKRISNQKKKGQNNSRCGNRYLSWAFVEVAQMARRYSPECRDFFERKAKQANTSVATKALACKLAKATWHMFKNKEPFDVKRAFPAPKPVKIKVTKTKKRKGSTS